MTEKRRAKILKRIDQIYSRRHGASDRERNRLMGDMLRWELLITPKVRKEG